MTLASDIIQRAYRENNILSINGALTINQSTEGLQLLNTILLSSIGNEIGEKLKNWPIGNLNVTFPYQWNAVFWQYPPINVRLIYNVDSPQTIFLPIQPCDGSRVSVVPTNGVFATNPLTLDGNGYLIDGAATLVIDTDDDAGAWIFRADLGEWIRYTQIAAGDQIPFPSEFDDYWATMLAFRLAPRNSNAVDPGTVEALKRWKRQITARYAQTVVTPADPAVLRLSEYDATSFNGNGPYGFGLGVNGWPW